MTSTTLLADSEAVFLDAGIGTWRWAAATDEFELSQETITLLQVREDELPLKAGAMLRYMHNDDVARFNAAISDVTTSSGVQQTEFRVYRDSGDQRWYRAVGRGFYDEKGQITHAAGVIIDVTAERHAEELQGTFFEQPNGIHIVAGTDGEIKLANTGWQLSLGYHPDELIGRNFLELIHDDDVDATLTEMSNLSRGIKTLYFENRYRHKNGKYHLIAWSAAVPEDGEDIYAIGKDITQERAAQHRLAQAAAVFNNSGEGIIVTDGTGVIKDVNAAFSRITGYHRSEVIGEHTRILRSGRHSDEFYKRMWAAIDEEGIWRGEIWNRRKSGETFPELLTITHFDGFDGGYIGIFTDISQLKATEEQLQQLAHYDQLTQLPNRYLINERLIQSLRRSRRRNLRLAVIFLDIDSFKNINDSLGHVAGDRLLTTTAQRLRDTLREDDVIGRIGGDEFLIVLEDITSPEDVTTIAEKIIGALRLPINLENNEVSVSASLGISLYPEDGQSAETLMSNADAAMYSAKEQGRDTFRFYSERMTREAFQHVLLDSALREAAVRNELRLAYQPQRNLETGQTVGLEVLVRWHHPQLGAVPPTQFIPHAERTGLIRGIGQWVLEQACRQGAFWLETGCEFGLLAVNVSASQFRDRNFQDILQETLDATGLPANHLELEITESILLRDTEELITKMQEIRDMGVRFAIDDFGTGYSSLSYLKRMPIDRLKLDQSFVRDVAEDGNNHIICDAVIALAGALGVEVIAEGIEEAAQERSLLELGCNLGQGYRYGVPQYAERIEPSLRDPNLVNR